MFNSQSYKKIMKECIRKKVKEFTQEIKPESWKRYSLLHYDNNIIVLQDLNDIRYYIINGKIYKEKVNIYPIFSIEEIKEALTQF